MDEVTPEEKYVVDRIFLPTHRARTALLRDHKRPGYVLVSEMVFHVLCPYGPIFIYAHPWPMLMGLEIHPDPNLRGFDVAVTERLI